MQIQYREPSLIEQINTAISTARTPIECIVLSQAEFQTVYNNLDKNHSKNSMTYSYKGIAIKVQDE